MQHRTVQVRVQALYGSTSNVISRQHLPISLRGDHRNNKRKAPKFYLQEVFARPGSKDPPTAVRVPGSRHTR